MRVVREMKFGRKNYTSFEEAEVWRHINIEDDVYEDMTCQDHVHCRIRVKPVDEHYEFVEAVNESAKRLSIFIRLTTSNQFHISIEVTNRRR